MKGPYTITVKDENGDIYVEGQLTSINLSTRYHTPGTIELEAKGFVTLSSYAKRIDSDNSGLALDSDTKAALTGIKDAGVTASKCNHKWKVYQGLQEKYNYCETCGVKQ